jgi:hypothetical protein
LIVRLILEPAYNELSTYALIEGVLAVLSTSVDVNPVSAVILAMNSLATLAFIQASAISSTAINLTTTEGVKSSETTKDISVRIHQLLRVVGINAA